MSEQPQVLDADDMAWNEMMDSYFSPYVSLMGAFVETDDHTLDGHFTLAQLEMIVRQIKKRMENKVKA